MTLSPELQAKVDAAREKYAGTIPTPKEGVMRQVALDLRKLAVEMNVAVIINGRLYK